MRANHLIVATLTVLVLIVLHLPLFVSSAHGIDLTNPLGNVTDIRVLIGRIIAAIIGVIGAIALLYFIYGGYLLLTSQGNAEMIRKGKETLIWAVLGLAVIFGSYAFLSTVIGGLTNP